MWWHICDTPIFDSLLNGRPIGFFQNELNALREAEDEERVAYERECRVKMEEEWKAREAVLRGN